MFVTLLSDKSAGWPEDGGLRAHRQFNPRCHSGLKGSAARFCFFSPRNLGDTENRSYLADSTVLVGTRFFRSPAMEN
jgi:hypothetical protein